MRPENSSELIINTCDGGVLFWGLLPPKGYKRHDVGVTSLFEPINGQLDSLTRKHLLVTVTTRKTKQYLMMNDHKNHRQLINTTRTQQM